MGRRVRLQAVRAALGCAAIAMGGAPLAAMSAAAPAARGLPIIITTRTVSKPKVQRTVGFNGYATYVFKAPRGRRIVTASARIVGGQAAAVKIRGRSLARNGKSYTVNLIFPGEQGTPGRLVVRLGTVAI